MKKILRLLAAFFVGGLVFGTAVLLVAPQSGEETRHDIKRKARKARKKTLTTYEDTRDQITDLIDDTSKKFQHLVRDINQTTQKQVDKLKDISQQIA